MKLENVFDSIKNSGQSVLEGFNSAQEVFDSFCVSEDQQKGIDIIYANYECIDYGGSATVFYYRRDTGKYYETYGSHCSCYGLKECPWENEEIIFAELETRLKRNNASALKQFRQWI